MKFFPDRVLATFKYAEQIVLQPTTGLASINAFRVTSLYDPNLTGTGHQPYQYDQVIAMYTYYLVMRLRYRITFDFPTSNGSWVGINILTGINTNDTASNKEISPIQERGHAICKPLNAQGNQNLVFTGAVEPWKILGVTKNQYLADPPNFGAAYNSNPTSAVILEIFAVDPSVGTPTIRAEVEFFYEAQLYGYLGPSTS